MNQDVFFVGVDIGGTKTYIRVEDREGNSKLLRHYLSADIGDKLTDKIQECILDAGISINEVAAVGIGVPGCVNNGIVMDAPGLGWRKYPLKEKIQKEFPFPVFLNNDVRMALIGEKYRAGKQAIQNMVFIAIGTGLGCAFLSDNSIVTGKANCAGEIGYFIGRQDVKEGLKNIRGEFGTMEKYISGTALSKAAAQWNLTSEELFSMCKIPGHPAKDIVDLFVSDLSILIANVVSLLDPEEVILGGGVSGSLLEYIPRINETVNGFTPLKAKISISKLGDKAGILGACEYGRNCYMQILQSQGKKVMNL